MTRGSNSRLGQLLVTAHSGNCGWVGVSPGLCNFNRHPIILEQSSVPQLFCLCGYRPALLMMWNPPFIRSCWGSPSIILRCELYVNLRWAPSLQYLLFTQACRQLLQSCLSVKAECPPLCGFWLLREMHAMFTLPAKKPICSESPQWMPTPWS